MKSSCFCLLTCVVLFVSPVSAQETESDSIKLLRELVAVRDANVGKITSWKGEVSIRYATTSNDIESVLSKRVQFVFDSINQNCRNAIRPENQGVEKKDYLPINEIALMRSDNKFFTLHSFLHNATDRPKVEYRPVEIFASLADLPGSGDFFDPMEHMDYSPASDDALKLFLEEIDKGRKIDTKLLNLKKSGEKVTLQSGSATWVYALDEGGLVVEYQASKPMKDLWTASHIEIDGIWLPAKVHSEQHFPDEVITTDKTWSNQELNFPTKGEFTVAKLGGFRGQRMFDHILDTRITLTGAEYPPPQNLWGSEGITAAPDKSRFRWLIWANILILVVIAVAIFVSKKKRSTESVRSNTK